MVSDDDYSSLVRRIEKLEGLGLTEAELKVIPSHKNNLVLPKYDTLCNLFDGAPVMIKTYDQTEWAPRIFISKMDKYYVCYNNGQTYFTCISEGESHWDYCRLPTIEESPRNTWLAHDGTGNCPEGAEDLDVMIWDKHCSLPTSAEGVADMNVNWLSVERFMILEK